MENINATLLMRSKNGVRVTVCIMGLFWSLTLATIPRQASAGMLVGSIAIAEALTPPVGGVIRREGAASNDTGTVFSGSNPNPDAPAGDYTYTGASQASTNLDASTFLKASATARSADASLFSPFGSASAYAAWRDVAHIGLSSPPSSIRLNFSIDGKLTAQLNPLPQSFPYAASEVQVILPRDPSDLADTRDAILGHADGTNAFPYFGTSDLAIARFSAPSNEDRSRSVLSDDQNVLPAGFATVNKLWDSIAFDPSTGLMQGAFHVDATFSSTNGGYVWALGLLVGAVGQGGSATADFMNTVQLTAVTQIDGTPISAVTFDSGLQINSSAVPEPSTLMMSSILSGIFGVIWSYKRFRETVAAI